MDGLLRKGSEKITDRERTSIPNPPKIPKLTAVTVFATAKFHPKVPEVIKNIAGSISGDANQNAITAPKGAPNASNAAIKGITSQEQKGDNPPRNAAITTMRIGFPSNARVSRFSAPVALRSATARTAKRMNGAVLQIEVNVEESVICNCEGSSSAI